MFCKELKHFQAFLSSGVDLDFIHFIKTEDNLIRIITHHNV